MNEVRFMEHRFGGWWCGVKFGECPDGRARRAARPMRFCEAVAASRTRPIVLTPESLNCPGGSRSLGWYDEQETIAGSMAEKAGLHIRVAREVLRQTPFLDDRVSEITVGTCVAPDVVLSYAQPQGVMKLLRTWQRERGRPLEVQASGFMSVCGAVAVNAYLSGSICISFGCPDAREHGSIGRDRLVVGLPVGKVQDLRRVLSAGAAETVPPVAGAETTGGEGVAGPSASAVGVVSSGRSRSVPWGDGEDENHGT